MRITSVGHAAFAAAMIALAIVGATERDLAPVWSPVPDHVPARLALVIAAGVVSLGCGVGLLFPRTAVLAARTLTASLVLWALAFRLPDIVAAPLVVGSYFGAAEIGVAIAAAWVLAVRLASRTDDGRIDSARRARALVGPRALFGLALVMFGVAHFVYLDATTVLIPNWLPAHALLAHLTGGSFVLAGVAVPAHVLSRAAAALAALQIGSFTAIVWVPLLLAGSKNPFHWSETILSAALTTAAWVVADSYQGTPWLATPWRRPGSVAAV